MTSGFGYYGPDIMSTQPRIAVVTNVIPQYREDMYCRLIDNYEGNIHIYCQKSIPGMNLNLVHEKLSTHVTLLKTFSMKKEKLAWQLIPVFKLIRQYDLIFFYGNPRVVSNLIWTLILKLLGKKIVIWGQYHTAGANPLMEKIRLGWWSLFDYLFLYTEREAEAYKKRFPSARLVAGMNNGLNQQEIDDAITLAHQKDLNLWKKEHGIENKILILSCARLVTKNRFEMVVECLPVLVKKYPDLVWCVIGDGEEKVHLQAKANELKVSHHIKWLGPIYSQDELAPWFLSSLILVHPGSIGLSLIHAMAYSLPVITHNNLDMQMPEIAAMEDGVNGLLFAEDDKEAFIRKLSRSLEEDGLLEALSKNARITVSTNYNTKMMAEKFIGMVNKIEEEM
ncbi:MAG: glycosyltransferase family 4 protein [Gammaproteobacteria bacterium]|nr:glycosyltransferase family 4 protein [Gammaproteobacteria bacterium]